MLTNQTTDTTSAATELAIGVNTILISGVLDGANLIFSLSSTSDGVFIPVKTYTSLDVFNIDVSKVCFVKVQQHGSRTLTNITVKLL